MSQTKEQINKIFDDWIDSKDTSQNIIEHLKSQKAFHIEFLTFYHDNYELQQEKKG